MSITQLLLDFLLNLLKDPKAAEEFKADPEGVLEKHGLGDISEEDCDAVIPVVLDFAPVSKIGDRDYETGGNVLKGGDSHYNGGGGHSAPTPSVGDGGAAAHAPAVAQLTHVVNNYSYSSLDDRDTILDQSVNQNIWALGDVYQAFDNDANVASGDYAVAAGDDAYVDNSDDHSTNIDVDVDGDVNIGNDDHSTDNSVEAGRDVNIGNEDSSVDVDVDVEDSIIANDSFNEEETDNSTNVDIDDSLLANDSFNEETTVKDSGNTEYNLENVGNDYSDRSQDTEVDVDADIDIKDSGNFGSYNDVETTEIDHTEIENTEINHTDNSFKADDVNVTKIDESLVIADNEVDVDVKDESHTDVYL